MRAHSCVRVYACVFNVNAPICSPLFMVENGKWIASSYCYVQLEWNEEFAKYKLEATKLSRLFFLSLVKQNNFLSLYYCIFSAVSSPYKAPYSHPDPTALWMTILFLQALCMIQNHVYERDSSEYSHSRYYSILKYADTSMKILEQLVQAEIARVAYWSHYSWFYENLCVIIYAMHFLEAIAAFLQERIFAGSS